MQSDNAQQCPRCQRYYWVENNDHCPSCGPEQPKQKSNVVRAKFGGTPFRQVGNMQSDIDEVVDKYRGVISLAEAVGVLEIVRSNLMKED